MITFISRDYQIIIDVDGSGDPVYVKFRNGDVLELERSSIPVPRGVRDVRWHQAYVADDEKSFVVPAKPDPLEIPWTTVRTLKDEDFAKRMARLAAEQVASIGARLRGLREERGLTQAQLASRAGIHPANLSRIENGHFDLSTSTLWKLLAAMGCSPSDLATKSHSRGR